MSVAVPVGEDATFTCAAIGEPTPTIQWYYTPFIRGVVTDNQYLVVSDEKYDITENPDDVSSTLLVRSVQPSDEGEYTCTAINVYNEDSATAFLQPLGEQFERTVCL